MTRSDMSAQLRLLRKTSRPIVIGPWMSEVGFELLYWIPFLRWAIESSGLPRERLHILSRGGCRSWYADLTQKYLELYDRYTPEQLKDLNQRRIREQAHRANEVGLRKGQIMAKQYVYTSIESRILSEVCLKQRVTNAHLIRPDMMYRLFRPIWRKRRNLLLYERWSEVTNAKRFRANQMPGLPDRYIAVKFYASEALPNQGIPQLYIRKIVQMLAEHIDVVLLHTGTAYDDHGEFVIEKHQRVHRVPFRPQTNLDEQTAIIAGARGFVGTYGGFAYLAPFLGIPTIGCFAETNFRRDHLELMRTVARRRLAVPFQALPLVDVVPNLQSWCGLADAA